MSIHMIGSIEFNLTPQPRNGDSGVAVSQMTIEKRYHGCLEAMGKGQKLTAAGGVQGSAGIVATERVSGTVHGRRQLRAATYRHHDARCLASGHPCGARLGRPVEEDDDLINELIEDNPAFRELLAKSVSSRAHRPVARRK
jgi:hypothetical protein